MSNTTTRCRWFKFSLRTLLIVVTLCALPCSWLAVKLRRLERQRNAVAAIEQLGGFVLDDWQVDADDNLLNGAVPPGPRWLHRWVSDNFWAAVRLVDIAHNASPNRHYASVTDSHLAHVHDLPQLRFVVLAGTQITGTGLMYLKNLSQLQRLDIGHTKITDAGLFDT